MGSFLFSEHLVYWIGIMDHYSDFYIGERFFGAFWEFIFGSFFIFIQHHFFSLRGRLDSSHYSSLLPHPFCQGERGTSGPLLNFELSIWG